MNKFLARLSQSLIVILLPVILVLGSVQILVTDAYLAFEYAKADFPEDPYGYKPDERFKHARDNIQYVRSGQSINALASQFHQSSPLYNVRELRHMQDVQNVFQATRQVWLVSLGGVSLFGVLLASLPKTRHKLAQSLGWGGGLTALIVLIASLLAVLAWQAWFQTFHQAFFQAGTWTFETTDTLIRLFPEKFWFDAALMVSGLSLMLGVMLYLIAIGSKSFGNQILLPFVEHKT